MTPILNTFRSTMYNDERHEPSWRAWGRPVFAVTVVAELITLGVVNIVMRAQWHEVEDGVLWASRAEGVKAVEVVSGAAGARAGVQRGDVLLAVNGAPVETAADVLEHQHRGAFGTRLSYTLL